MMFINQSSVAELGSGKTQGPQDFSFKGQTVNFFSSVGHMWSLGRCSPLPLQGKGRDRDS